MILGRAFEVVARNRLARLQNLSFFFFFLNVSKGEADMIRKGEERGKALGMPLGHF